MLVGFEDKSAQAICTFAYCEGPGSDCIIFQGRTHVCLDHSNPSELFLLTSSHKGKLVPARGPANFGWDPAFEYEGRTYAEMANEEKNKISHRGKALAKLQAWLQDKHSSS